MSVIAVNEPAYNRGVYCCLKEWDSCLSQVVGLHH